jgi:hypothetical protein
VVRRPVLLGAAALLVAAIAAAVLVVLFSGTTSVAAALRDAGCTDRDVAPYPPEHDANYHLDYPTLTTKEHWSTFPPSAGGHYRLWATWGFYREPVNPRMAVHNAEHGGVVLWWGPEVPAATVSELKRFYDEQPVGVLATPLAGLGNRLALTAWTADPKWKGDPAYAYERGDYGTGHVAICTRFDEKAFAAFRDAYRGHSPQGFPLAEDRPGCGPRTSC